MKMKSREAEEMMLAGDCIARPGNGGATARQIRGEDTGLFARPPPRASLRHGEGL